MSNKGIAAASNLKVFGYRSPRLTVTYVVLGLAAAVFAYLPFYIGDGHVGSLSVLPLFAWLILFLMPVAFLGVLFGYYIRSRPIEISDDGISNLIVGHRWKFIKWPQIKQIEKFRIYDSFFSTYQNVFVVSADGARIRFDDWIGDLSSLLAVLNANIEKHQIPAFAVDRGRDTLQKMSSASMTSGQRKKLLRDGVRQPVTHL